MALYRKLSGIWYFLKNKNLTSTVTVNEVKEIAIKKGLKVNLIEERNFGFYNEIQAIYLKTDTGSALYPRKKLEDYEKYNKSKEPKLIFENFWKYIDWFLPPHVPRGLYYDAFKEEAIDTVNYNLRDKRSTQQSFENCLSLFYSIGNISSFTSQNLTRSSVISKHVPIIKESVFAFYSGFKVLAISALIPIIEDILNAIIGSEESSVSLIENVNKCIDKAHKKVIDIHKNNANWIPTEYTTIEVMKTMNEHAFCLETIRHWLLNSFYAKTDNYNNHSGFNRHHFAHAKSFIWQNSHNFFRAFGLIQALAYIEFFAVDNSKVGLFYDEPDQMTNSFYQEIMMCLNTQFLKNQVLQNIQIKNCLPFNITASTDGWTGRSIKLSETMNTDIIKKLQEKGWQCQKFTDPIKDGEYITINAVKDKRELKIALIYSCATENNIYMNLDNCCDIILYLGAHYKQNSYAYGINATVLPINAWIVPD